MFIETLLIKIGKYSPNKIGDERYRRATWTSLTLIISQILTVLTGMITIPLLSRYLGSELFGLWMIITNFVSFLIFADFGIGIGFRNQLIRCFASNDYENPRLWTANALLIMLTMAILIILTSIFILPLFHWEKLFGASTLEARDQMLPSIQWLAIAFSIGLPAMLLEYIGNAYQRGYLVYSLIALGRLLSLGGIIIGCYLKFTLPILIVIFIATPYILCLVGMFILWIHVPWLRPCNRGLSVEKMKKLFHVGIGMLGIRITHALAMQGPSLLTASLIGIAEAGTIAVVQKILTIPSMIIQPLIVATQGAMGEAAHKSEWRWIKKNIIGLMRANFWIYFLTTLIIVVIGGGGLLLLLGTNTVVPNRIILFMYCIYHGLSTVRLSLSSFLTVIDRVYTQSLYRFAALLLSLYFLFTFEQTSFSIIATLIVLAEIPQFLCTITEVGWVFYRRLSI
ncbi:MAG: lipopolysaccharide biosynthesis protein [Syntrophorhabdaceae bacterium]